MLDLCVPPISFAYLNSLLVHLLLNPIMSTKLKKKKKERNQGQFSASIITRVWELQNENKYDEEIWVL